MVASSSRCLLVSGPACATPKLVVGELLESLHWQLQAREHIEAERWQPAAR
jgi:hypothetical protein